MTPSMHGPLLVVANPRAGRGGGGVLGELVDVLTRLGVDHRVARTGGPQHATTITRRVVATGEARFLVAVGGDGTVNEVVNGLLDPETGTPVAEDLVLGVVSAGSGSDLARTFGLRIPMPRLAEQHLLTPTTTPLDVGRVRVTDAEGIEQTRLFVNVAQAGWGAEVTRRARLLPRALGGARYPVAIAASTAAMRSTPTRLTLDHTEREEDVLSVVVANGQFFGSGLKIAPRALPDDGRFSVQTWRGTARDVARLLPLARVGEHTSDPAVREWQSSTVRVVTRRPCTVEVDGEVVGTTPAGFDLLPRALALSV